MDLLKARERAKERDAEKQGAAKKKSAKRKTPRTSAATTKKARPKKKSATTKKARPKKKSAAKKSGAKQRAEQRMTPAAPKQAAPVAPEDMVVTPEEFPTFDDVPEVAELPVTPEASAAVELLETDSPVTPPASPPPTMPDDMVVTPEEFPTFDDVPEIAELPPSTPEASGQVEAVMLSEPSTSAPAVSDTAPGSIMTEPPPVEMPAMKVADSDHLERLTRLLHAETEFEKEERFREQVETETVYDPNRATVVCFRLGDEVYGLELDNIKEIIRLRMITEVPRCPPSVVGVIALRGIIVPVLDLRLRLELPEAEPTKETRIIIVQAGESLVGLRVDAVKHVVRLPRSSIEPSPPTMGGGLMEFVSGVGRTEQQDMIILLNADKVAHLERGRDA